MRRQIAAGADLWRTRWPGPMEPLLGPVRGTEQLGLYERLDGALSQESRSLRAGNATTHLVTALTALAVKAEAEAAPPTLLAQTLSDAAFAVGARALEALADSPGEEDAVAADVAGTLDEIDALAEALTKDHPAPAELAALTAQLDALRARSAARSRDVGAGHRAAGCGGANARQSRGSAGAGALPSLPSAPLGRREQPDRLDAAGAAPARRPRAGRARPRPLFRSPSVARRGARMRRLPPAEPRLHRRQTHARAAGRRPSHSAQRAHAALLRRCRQRSCGTVG